MTRYLAVLLSALILTPAALPSAAQTVGSGDIKKNAVRGKHVKKNAVKSSDIKNGAITQRDLKSDLVAKMFCCDFEVLDHTGQIVGTLIVGEFSGAMIRVTQDNMLAAETLEVDAGDFVQASMLRGFFYPQVMYTGANCDGNVYVFPERKVPLVQYLVAGLSPTTGKMTGYLPDPNTAPSNVTTNSQYEINPVTKQLECAPSGYSGDFVPAIPVIDLNIYTPPFSVRQVQ